MVMRNIMHFSEFRLPTLHLKSSNHMSYGWTIAGGPRPADGPEGAAPRAPETGPPGAESGCCTLMTPLQALMFLEGREFWH
jgi:hypothetical protein